MVSWPSTSTAVTGNRWIRSAICKSSTNSGTPARRRGCAAGPAPPESMRLRLAGLAMLAITGQLVLNQAVATIGRGLGKDWTIFTLGFDFHPIWELDIWLVRGLPGPRWYGAGFSNAWPPPHEVLLSPLAFLSYDGAHVASLVLTAALVVFAVVLWSSDRFGLPGPN